MCLAGKLSQLRISERVGLQQKGVIAGEQAEGENVLSKTHKFF